MKKTIYVLVIIIIIITFYIYGEHMINDYKNKSAVPGGNNKEDVNSVFIVNDSPWYLLNNGNLYQIVDSKPQLQYSFPDFYVIEWNDKHKNFFYINNNRLLGWNPVTKVLRVIWQAENNTDKKLLCVTEDFALIHESSCFYIVNIETNEVKCFYESSNPYIVITKYENSVFYISADMSTIFEIDCCSSEHKKIFSEEVYHGDPIVAACVSEGYFYYSRSDGRLKAFSMSSSEKISVPVLPDSQLKHIVGLSPAYEGLLAVAAEDVNDSGRRTILYRINLDEETITQRGNKHEGLLYSVPGSCVISTRNKQYCYAVKTGGDIVYGNIE